MKGCYHSFTDAGAVPLFSALDLGPLALPKHHLLAVALLRSGGSRMGSSPGKEGRDR